MQVKFCGPFLSDPFTEFVLCVNDKFQKIKKRGQGVNSPTFSQNLASEDKATTMMAKYTD